MIRVKKKTLILVLGAAAGVVVLYFGAQVATSYAWGSRVCERVAFMGQTRPERFTEIPPDTELPAIFHSVTQTPECCLYIAHAGGAVNGTPYTNSPEALAVNYAKGARVFEIDFTLAGNGDIVLAHDFNAFAAPPESEAAFLAMPAPHGQSHMSFDTLMRWLLAHPDARLVTDTKFDGGPRRIAEKLAEALPREVLENQVIFQVYSLEELADADLRIYGAPIILTVYKLGTFHPGDLIGALEQYPPMALTMSSGRAPKLLQLTRLYLPDLPLYVHGHPSVINDTDLQSCLEALGASGFYLD